MTEKMEKFLALAKENEELSEKLEAGVTKEELTALVKEHGIELTDEQLDDVAGGLLRIPGWVVP